MLPPSANERSRRPLLFSHIPIVSVLLFVSLLVAATTSLAAPPRTDHATSSALAKTGPAATAHTYLPEITKQPGGPAAAVAEPTRYPNPAFELVDSLGGYVSAIEVVGTTAYLGSGHGITVFDVSDPTRPTPLTRVPLPSPVARMHCYGDMLYVAGLNGIWILDLTDPTQPRILGSFITAARANDVLVIGDLAYVGYGSPYSNPPHESSDTGVLILDVHNPAATQAVATYATTEAVTGLALAGGLLYLSRSSCITERGGLTGLDISNPAAPVPVFDRYGGMWPAMEVVGKRAYALAVACNPSHNSSTTLRIFDVSNPSDPVVLYSTQIDWQARRWLYVAEGRAYVGPWSWDVVNLDGDRLDGAAFPAIGDMRIVGGLAYVADENNELRVIDVRDPEHATVIGTYHVPRSFTELQVADNNVYALVDDVLHIYTTAPDGQVALAGSYSPLTEGQALRISGKYAFVLHHEPSQLGWFNRLSILEIDNPAAIHRVGYYDIGWPTSVGALEVVGDHVYIAGGVFAIIEVSNPAEPRLLANPEWLGHMVAVRVVDDIAYAVTEAFSSSLPSYEPDIPGKLMVLDVHDPVAPRLLNAYPLPDMGSATDIQVVGKMAFISYFTQYNGRISLIDISDPANPVLRREFQALNAFWREPMSVSIGEGCVLVAQNEGGVNIIEVGDSRLPRTLAMFTYWGRAYRAQLVGDLMYVADIEGLLVVRVHSEYFRKVMLPVLAQASV